MTKPRSVITVSICLGRLLSLGYGVLRQADGEWFPPSKQRVRSAMPSRSSARNKALRP